MRLCSHAEHADTSHIMCSVFLDTSEVRSLGRPQIAQEQRSDSMLVHSLTRAEKGQHASLQSHITNDATQPEEQ